MVHYQVFCEVPTEEAAEWSAWMRDVHIPDVMRTQYFLSAQFCAEAVETPSATRRFATVYTVQSMEQYEMYRREAAPALQAHFRERYADRVQCERHVLDVQQTF